MKIKLSLFLLSLILLFGCLQTIDEELGFLDIHLQWPEHTTMFEQVNLIKIKLQPGDLNFSFLKDDSISIESELGIYNISVDALDVNDRILYSVEIDKVLVETFKTTIINLDIEANFPVDIPQFIGIEKQNVIFEGNYQLDWNSVDRANQYRLVESPDSLFNSLTVMSNDTATSYSVFDKPEGDYFYKVSAENENGQTDWSDWVKFTIHFIPTLEIETDTLPTGKLNENYNFNLIASGGTTPYNWSISSGSLPNGLELNTETGVISGIPVAVGVSSFTILVNDISESQQTVTKDFIITILSEDLLIASESLVEGQIEEFYKQQLVATGGITPYNWSLVDGSLPDGLDLTSESGVISGIPIFAGTYTFTIRVTDSSNESQYQEGEFSITINPENLTIHTKLLPDGKVGENYDEMIIVTGGTEPYSGLLTEGALPDGLAFDEQVGAISGTPTHSGIFIFTIKISDSGEEPQDVEQEFSITIILEELILSTEFLSNGKVGESYQEILFLQGGTEPYTWSITKGSLPDGLRLESGIISGIPTTSGTSTFTIKCVDASNPQQSVQREFTITIIPEGLLITVETLPNGIVGNDYTTELIASGGTKPYNWSISSGSLPDGLDLDSETGLFSGQPSVPGEFIFIIVLNDDSDPMQSTSKEFTIEINAADLIITSMSLPSVVVGEEYSYSFKAEGGILPYNWTIDSGEMPEGLIYNNLEGTITGIPTIVGTRIFTVQVADSDDPQQTDTKICTLKVNPSELTILTETINEGKVSEIYSETLTASGGVSPFNWTVSIGSLPAGLILDNESGEISGTPSIAGTSIFTIKVTDTSDPQQSVERDFSILILPENLILVTETLADGKVGESYNEILSASGGISPYIWSVVSGSLSDGLVLESETGAIFGTPTQAGSYSFKIQITDADNPQQIATKDFTLEILVNDLEILTSSMPNMTVGNSYTISMTAKGGVKPYIWSIISGNLPDGIQLNENKITGSPSTIGSYNFIIQVSDASNPQLTGQKQFTITVEIPELEISTNSLSDGQIGTYYSEDIEANGGTEPYNWSIISGNLPNGLALSENVISGTPTTTGTTSFTFRVEDSGSPQQVVQKVFEIRITPQPLSISTNSLPDGMVDGDYYETLSASGGTTPYTWSIISGNLPDGLALSGNEISGTPTTGGSETFTIQVSDVGSPQMTDSKQFTITIEALDLEITTSSLPNATAGENYSQQLQATGGTGNYTWQKISSAGDFPEGITLASNGIISGNPGIQPSSGTITVEVADVGVQMVTKTLSLTVEAADLELFTSVLQDGQTFTEYWGYILYRFGTAPLQTPWTITGDFPEGMTISYDAQNYQMNLSGTPTKGGTSNFSITVYDSSSPQKSRTDSFSITINP